MEAFRAIKTGDTDLALEQIASLDSERLFTLRDEEEMSLLAFACYHGQTQVVDKLIKLGCGVNEPVTKSKYYPLMFAVMSGNRDLVQLLLDNKAEVMACNSARRTAKDLAALIGQHEIASQLVDHQIKSTS
eukprot:TRINITY_DN27279_c0_g1_i1.p1 TRINITY_DN27279_c0_g1~~TRINITY_DN27279_c0_g1_i1.p1  ORF type:complete len:131 (+),score=14.74 TRINITY_DN27279_c0_g1_i1:118-510(+)